MNDFPNIHRDRTLNALDTIEDGTHMLVERIAELTKDRNEWQGRASHADKVRDQFKTRMAEAEAERELLVEWIVTQYDVPEENVRVLLAERGAP